MSVFVVGWRLLQGATIILAAIVLGPFYYYGIYEADAEAIIGSALDWKWLPVFTGMSGVLLRPIAGCGFVLLPFLALGLAAWGVVRLARNSNEKIPNLFSVILGVLVCVPYILYEGRLVNWYFD